MLATITDNPMTMVIGICALCNVCLVLTQMLVIPFVRGIRTEMKELIKTIHEHQITMIQMQGSDKSTADLVLKLESRQTGIESRYHILSNKLTDLLLHLAYKKVYVPKSIREQEQEGRT